MRSLRIGIAAFVLLAGCRAAQPPGPPPLAAWIEFAPDNRVAIRAVTEAPACPEITVDGKRVRMDERAAPDDAFPIRACAATVPRPAGAIALAGRNLPPVPSAVRRIVVFGDTGCRLKGAAVQSCNDPAAWPFAEVARRAAEKHPDLVIHVGDYHYRETPCPAGLAGCAGTPAGDNWAVWSADFFAPAAPLLEAAPWVMVRGNHELCGRGGKGWFRLLDPAPSVRDCPDFTEPYAVRLDGFGLVVADSASADDAKPVSDLVRRFGESFAQVAAASDGPFWLLTHRPVWGLAPVGARKMAKAALAPINATEQAAIDPSVPAGLDMVVSGHVHTFASYDFGGARPAQLVVGTGGSRYDEMQLDPGTRIDIDGMAARAFAMTRYGYLVMDRSARAWDGTFYDALDDHVLARCSFEGRSAACR